MGDRRAEHAVSAARASSPGPARHPDRALAPRRYAPPAGAAAWLSHGGIAHGQMAAVAADLQRYLGNRYTGRVLQAMRQDRLVSSPSDRWEREADRVADRVTSPATVPAVSRGGHGGPAGMALPAPVRAPLESELGSDFSAVRVHTDSGADRLARGMGAVAFTSGQDIFFRRGHYDPGGRPGRRLLTHELAHVVQQQGAAAPPIQRKMGLEYELDDIHTRHTNSWGLSPSKSWIPHNAGDVMMDRTDYALTADVAAGAIPYSRLEFRTRPFDETNPHEIREMLAAVENIRQDIRAIKVATLHNLRGYGAGSKYSILGGRDGWFAGEGWVGLDKIPRLHGPWYQQVNYAGRLSKDAIGQLQLTAGFSLDGLQRLVSGAELGNAAEWPEESLSDWRQYVPAYARATPEAPLLFQVACNEVRSEELYRGGGPRAKEKMAAIISVMAQMPLAARGATFDVGIMLAKTDYAKIISMARDEGMEFTSDQLLHALLNVVNSHLDDQLRVNADSPVIPHVAPVDVSRVSFRQWVTSLVPPAPGHGPIQAMAAAPPVPVDLMTQASYPGTPAEKAGLRAYGPYRHADPGERAIFEVRELMKNPAQDLSALVAALTDLMRMLNR